MAAAATDRVRQLIPVLLFTPVASCTDLCPSHKDVAGFDKKYSHSTCNDMHENQAFDRYLVATQCANISQSIGWQGVLSRWAHILATRKPLLGTHKQRHTIEKIRRNEINALSLPHLYGQHQQTHYKQDFTFTRCFQIFPSFVQPAEQSLTARTNSLQAFFLRCKSRELCGAPRNAEPTCSVALGDRRWRLRSTRSKNATMAASS